MCLSLSVSHFGLTRHNLTGCQSVSIFVFKSVHCLLVDTCRLDGPDAKKTACYDIDVEVVSVCDHGPEGRPGDF